MYDAETHIFILWSKAMILNQRILDDISLHFDVEIVKEISWKKTKFANNIARFYGLTPLESLMKVKHCGDDSFLCIIIKDRNPSYEPRETSSGVRVVNTRTFDAKIKYRRWTGGGHKIHASDDSKEALLQLELLFGDWKLATAKETNALKKAGSCTSLIGTDGWDSFEELFRALNRGGKYVVLRNFNSIERQIDAIHPDVDLLVENKNEAVRILNCTSTTNKVYRSQYAVKVSGREIFFDLRSPGDNYYDINWSSDILETRVAYGGFYVPNANQLLHTLLYHALIHKQSVSKDYMEHFLRNLNMKCPMTEDNLFRTLQLYMRKNNYIITEPDDITVYYNTNLINRYGVYKVSKFRMFNDKYLSIRSSIKLLITKIFKKLND